MGRHWVEVSIFFLTLNSVIEICYFIPVHNLFNVMYKGTQTVTDVFSLFYSKVVNKKTIFILQLPLLSGKGQRFSAVLRGFWGTLPHRGLGLGTFRDKNCLPCGQSLGAVQAELEFSPILSAVGCL